MSGHFQYFITPPAGKATLLLEECAQFGIGYAFDADHPPKNVRCHSGPRPDGSGGMVVCADTGRIGYYPERQKWRSMIGNPDVWVGMEFEHRPTPKDVARKQQADGETLTLGGMDWLIPRARQWEDNDGQLLWMRSLPSVLDISPDGKWVHGEVIEQYAELWTTANDYIDGNGENAEPLFSAALRANYRIGLTEWALLGLIDSQGDAFKAVLDIVLDEQRGMELLKKTEHLAGGISTGSDGASQQTTDEQPATGPQYQSHEPGFTDSTKFAGVT